MNYNNKDIQKIEKAAQKALVSLKKKMPKAPKILKPKFMLSCVALIGLSYLGYRIFEHKGYVNSHYVDMFALKAGISNSVQRKDLFQKLKQFSLQKNENFAVEEYERNLRSEFTILKQKLKQKRVLKMYENYQNFNDEKQKQKVQNKDEKLDNRMEIVLTKNRKIWLDLGYLKLHMKQYMNTVTNQGDYIKKTYISPIVLFDTPFFGVKKQQKRRIGKKDRYSKVLKDKSHFDLHSQCQKINYWNLLINNDRPYERKNIGDLGSVGNEQIKIGQISNENAKEKQNVKNKKEYGNFKTQLLFECRKKIRKVEQEFKKQLIQVMDEYWQNKPKEYVNY